MAERTSDLECVSVCRGCNHVYDSLHLAAEYGHVRCALSMLGSSSVELNTVDAYGATALHKAAHNNRADMVSLLVDAGALVNAVDDDGDTPLTLAIAAGSCDAAHTLIDRGASFKPARSALMQPTLTATYSRSLGLPFWVLEFIYGRRMCCSVAVLIMGIHKYKRTHVTGQNDGNVMRMISKHIWSTRLMPWPKSLVSIVMCCKIYGNCAFIDMILVKWTNYLI
jgi:hypothetical protein